MGTQDSGLGLTGNKEPYRCTGAYIQNPIPIRYLVVRIPTHATCMSKCKPCEFPVLVEIVMFFVNGLAILRKAKQIWPKFT